MSKRIIAIVLLLAVLAIPAKGLLASAEQGNFSVNYTFCHYLPDQNGTVYHRSIKQDEYMSGGYEFSDYFDVQIEYGREITISLVPRYRHFECGRQGGPLLDEGFCFVLSFVSEDGISLISQFDEIMDRNFHFKEGPSSSEGGTETTVIGIDIWTETDETVSYYSEGKERKIHIIMHTAPDESIVLNDYDFIVDYSFGKRGIKPNKVAYPLEDYFDIVIDHSGATITVTPLYTYEQFQSMTNGEYVEDTCIWFLLDSFKEINLYQIIKRLSSINGAFSTIGGGGAGWQWESNVAIALWTENDETITYECPESGEEKSIRFVTHAGPNTEQPDISVDYTFCHYIPDQDGSVYHRSINQDEYLSGGYDFSDYFDVQVDYDEETTILLTPKFIQFECERLGGPMLDEGVCFVLSFVSEDGITLNNQFAEIIDRNSHFKEGPNSSDGGTETTVIGIDIWTETDETVSYYNSSGKEKTIRIIMHTAPDESIVLNDYDFVVDYMFGKKVGIVNDDGTVRYKIEGDYPIDDYFDIDIDRNAGKITITPLYSYEEFTSMTGGEYGDDISICLTLDSFKSIDILSKMQELYQVNDSFFRLNSGGANWQCANIVGILLWTENDEEISYECPDTGEEETIRIVTYAVPATELLLDTFTVEYDFYHLVNGEISGDDYSESTVDLEGLKDYFYINIDYPNKAIAIEPYTSPERLNEVTGGCFGENYVLCFFLRWSKNYAYSDVQNKLLELSQQNGNFGVGPSGETADGFFASFYLEPWREAEERIVLSKIGSDGTEETESIIIRSSSGPKRSGMVDGCEVEIIVRGLPEYEDFFFSITIDDDLNRINIDALCTPEAFGELTGGLYGNDFSGRIQIRSYTHDIDISEVSSQEHTIAAAGKGGSKEWKAVAISFIPWSNEEGSAIITLTGDDGATRTLELLIALSCPIDEPASTHVSGHNLALEESFNLIYYVRNENIPIGAETGLLIWTSPQSKYELGDEAIKLTKIGTETIKGVEYDKYILPGIAAKQMCNEMYAVSYYKKASQIGYSGLDKYSVMQYLYSKAGSTSHSEGSPVTLGELVEKIGEYGTMAQQYFRYNMQTTPQDSFALITLVNGAFADGTTKNFCKLGTMLEITANMPEGELFDHWENDKGVFLGSSESLVISAEEGTYTIIAKSRN